jgi:hypothetical protein
MNPACAHLNVAATGTRWLCCNCGTPFVLARFAPLTPWSTLAAVVEERNRYYAEVAALRSQVEELMRCGVSTHKAAQGAVDFERANVDDILTAMVNEGNDAAAEVIGRLARERGQA